MSGKDKTPPIPLIPKNRLETLADGIFAIAMTLLVLSIEVPTLPSNPTAPMISDYVFNTLMPQISIYVLSFALLAVFWMNHHIFFVIKRTNTTLLWINIFWLMSIAIFPFSTSMMGKYGVFQLSQIIFDVNMLIIGILSYVNWTYAAKKGMIIENVMPYADKIKLSFLFLPILSLIAILISFIIPYGSIFVFILIPTIFTLYTVSKRHKV
ncbi:MAG: DUF1211 domain-containing protein [Methanobacterium sp.]|nr:DUF1211 domain-containing protein [Methanobacterium sp.]